MTQKNKWPFPWPQQTIATYTAFRVDTPPVIDGKLDEICWQHAPRSPRFCDLISGAPALYDTRAAVLWDDENLYVGYWVEEPNVQARLTERDALIYEDNDFLSGKRRLNRLAIICAQSSGAMQKACAPFLASALPTTRVARVLATGTLISMDCAARFMSTAR